MAVNRNNRPRQQSRHNSIAPLTQDKHHPHAIAAIPCFNEERFIGSVVLKARKYVDQVIVIDDGSTDKTAMVAELAGATVIKHNCNEGKGVAICTAFEHARNTGCTALLLLDGDGQHEPSEIPKLLKPVLDGLADMVVGSRFLTVRGEMPLYRAWGQRLLTFFTNMGSQTRLTDSQSGFRAFSLKAMEALAFAEKGLSVESEMQFLAKEAGLRVTEVPITAIYQDKAKRSPIAHGVGVLNSIMALISRRMPLVFFGVPGVVMLGLGIWQGLRVVREYSASGEFIMGPALITVLLCIVGVLSLFTGLILYSIRSFLR